MRKFVLLAAYACLFTFLHTTAQNVAINNDGSLPTIGALLDVKSNSKGILIPRIALTGTDDIITVPDRPASLLLYNVATTSGPNAVSPGFYYWDATGWVRLTTNTSALVSGWLLGGNTGTSSATHFLGTTDNNSLVFKVNNQKAGYIGIESNDGNVFWGYQSGNSNTGYSNVGIGVKALYSNTERSNLVAIGDSALFNNTTGTFNTAVGSKSMFTNTTGHSNTANGKNALYTNSSGNGNTAHGSHALYLNTTGEYNTANGHAVLYRNTTGRHNTAIGSGALYSNTVGNFNSASGYSALVSNSTGSNSVANGFEALFSNTTGYSNVAIGVKALYSNTDISNLVAIGDSALFNNITGFHNTAIGSKSMFSNTIGNSNTASGINALYTNSSGNGNTAHGSHALYLNTTGEYNTANGHVALYRNSTGAYNTAIGFAALYSNTTGQFNTGIGNGALYSNSGGYYNSASGYSALNSNLTGSNNVANGHESLFSNTTGQSNTATGYHALYSNITGSFNSAIGNQAQIGNFSNTNYSNATAVGSRAQADCSNCLVLGSINGVNGATTNVNVGIGTTSPAARLDVAGGNWDLIGGEGDVRIGTPAYRIKMGIAASGGGAGDAGIMQFGQPGGYNVLSLGSQGNKILFLNGTTARAGIGLDNPTEKLEVNGNVKAFNVLVPSDIRFKRNITSIEDALDRILQLSGYHYYFKEENPDQSLQSGLIAQEVQKLIPELVKADDKGMLSVNYQGFIPFLIQSIKEQNARIDQLSKENVELKKLRDEVAELKRMILRG